MKKYKPSKEFVLSAVLLFGSFFVFQGIIIPTISYGPKNVATVSKASPIKSSHQITIPPFSSLAPDLQLDTKAKITGTLKNTVPCNNTPGEYVCNGGFESEQITDPFLYPYAFACPDPFSYPSYVTDGYVPFWCAGGISTLAGHQGPTSPPVASLPTDCSVEPVWPYLGTTFAGCVVDTPDGSENVAIIGRRNDDINYSPPYDDLQGGITTELEETLTSGEEYHIEYDVRVLSYGNGLPDELIIASILGSELNGLAPDFGWPYQFLTPNSVPYNQTDNSWIHIEENFIANDNYDYVLIYNGATLGLNPNHRSYFYIDNVSIREVGTDVDIQVSNTLTDSTLTATDRHVTFKVEIANAGPATASNIVVHNQLPASFAYYSHTTPSPNTYNSTSGNLSIPTLLPGQTTLVEIVMNVPTSACGVKIDTANLVSVDQVESDSANNQASASIQMPKACADRVPAATY